MITYGTNAYAVPKKWDASEADARIGMCRTCTVTSAARKLTYTNMRAKNSALNA